jgi:hypothetical protein
MYRRSAIAILLVGFLFAPARIGRAQPVTASTNHSTPLASSLVRMNYYRAMTGAEAVKEFPSLNDDATNHSRYVVLNHIQPGDVTIVGNHLKGAGKYSRELHTEDPKLEGYSSGGASIARGAVIAEADAIPSTGTDFVDRLMTNPSNAMLVLDPELRFLSYGQYCGNGLCAATFKMRQQIFITEFRALYRHTASERDSDSRGMRPMYFRKPIEFPPEGSSTTLRIYEEQLSVDPLSSCPGYATPSGLPIFVSLGRYGHEDTPLLTSHALVEDGNPIEHCAYDGSNYSNKDATIQDGARKGMSFFMMAVIVPRLPLKIGSAYDVSMTIDSVEHSWKFKVAPDAH